jgi:Ser/Thr protein kinase RdoA (MazF antagonist)
VTSPLPFAPDGAGEPGVALSTGWGLAAAECVPVGGGFVHRSFRVTTETGEHLLLQELNRHFFTDLDALAANVALVGGALRTPARVRTTTTGRRWFADDDGRGWRLMTWIDGTIQAPAFTGAEVAAKLGTAFARFHLDVVDVDPERLHVTIPNFHDPARRAGTLAGLVKSDPNGRSASSQAALQALGAARALVDVAVGWRSPEVPTRVAHLDATPGNVLLDAESRGIVAVIDLDTVMPSSWLWDVGELVRSGCTRLQDDATRPEDAEVFDEEAADVLLETYTNEVGAALSPAELAALPIAGAVVAYERALQFVTDHLEGDVMFRVDRPDENLERAQLQLSLARSIQEYAERKAGRS